MQFNFTKKHTQMTKGIAIILMLIHHLFAYPDRLKYQYIGFLKLEQNIGEFGKICVAMFLFLSGFGVYYTLYKSNTIKESFKKSINKIKLIYFNYWIVFLLFIPIGFLLFNVKFNLLELLLNFLGIESSYNYEWWFFRTYIILLISSPVFINKISNKNLLAFFEIFFGFVLSKILMIIGNGGYLLEEVVNLLIWTPCFYMGVYFAKFDMFDYLKQLFKKIKLDNKIIYLIIGLLIICFNNHIPGGTGRDALITPIFIICIINIFDDSKAAGILTHLGKHSNNMWLVHSFFCYYYFQKVLFSTKISVLILLLLIVLSLLTSYVINYISSILINKNFKFHQDKNLEAIT